MGKQAGRMGFINQAALVAGRMLPERRCWLQTVPRGAAALLAETQRSIDPWPAGCFHLGAANGPRADTRERCGGSAGSSATPYPASVPPALPCQLRGEAGWNAL